MTDVIQLVWLAGGVLLLIWGIEKVRLWRACVWLYWWCWQRRRIQLDDRAQWRNYRYTDSATGRITIGIELVTPDHRMIDDCETQIFAEHTPDEKLIDADELAMRRAAVLNVERTPERMRMYRIRQEEMEEVGDDDDRA